MRSGLLVLDTLEGMPDDRLAGSAPPTAEPRAESGAGIHKWLGWILAVGALAGCLLLFDFGEMLGEVMAVVGMANETNRLANGYQVEIDEMFRKAL